MSKAQQLGFGANYANLNLNINPQGIINDAERYPEVTKKTFEEVAWYQTQFRRQLLSIYTQQPSIDNLCVNIILEQGFGGYIYRQAAKYFVLSCFQYTGANNGQLPNDVGNTFAKAAVFTMDSVVAELKVVKQDPNSQQWFQWLSQFFNQPAANFFMQVRRQVLANMSSGGIGHSAPPQNNMGYPQQQSGGMGYPAPQNSGMGYSGNVMQAPQQQQATVSTGLAMDYLETHTPVQQPQQSTESPQTQGAYVENNILHLGADEHENNIRLSQRRMVGGMWMTNKVTGNGVNVLDLSEWTLLGDGFTINLDNIDERNRALNDIVGWADAINSELGSFIDGADVDYYGVFDPRWDKVIPSARKLYHSFMSRAINTQLGLFANNSFYNNSGYYCGITDSVWGHSSLYDLICEQHGSESLDAIPDDDLVYTVIGHRIYPVIKSTSFAAQKWAKRYRGKSTLPTLRSEYHGYLILPVWDNETNKQTLHICSIIKRGQEMDLDKYKVDDAPVAPANNNEDKTKTDVKVAEPTIVDSGQFLPGAEIGTMVTTLRLMYQDNPNDVLLATKVEPSYFIISDVADGEYFDSLRVQVGTSINDISDLAGVVLDAKGEGLVSNGFVQQLSTLIGSHLFNYIVNELGITALSLEASLIEEIASVKEIILSECDEQTKVNYMAAERAFLSMLFTQYDDDYLSTLVNHFKAVTGFQVTQNHGKYRVKLPGADKTIVFGQGIIPMVNETLILALPINDYKLNPDGEPEVNGYRLGTVVIDWLKGIWKDLNYPVNLVTADGITYTVNLPDVDDELSSPLLTRI